MPEKDLATRFVIFFVDRPDLFDDGLGKTAGIAIEQHDRHVGALVRMELQITPDEVENAGASFRWAVVGFVVAFGCENGWFVQAVVLNYIA